MPLNTLSSRDCLSCKIKKMQEMEGGKFHGFLNSRVKYNKNLNQRVFVYATGKTKKISSTRKCFNEIYCN
jgi:hypothetical protein